MFKFSIFSRRLATFRAVRVRLLVPTLLAPYMTRTPDLFNTNLKMLLECYIFGSIWAIWWICSLEFLLRFVLLASLKVVWIDKSSLFESSETERKPWSGNKTFQRMLHKTIWECALVQNIQYGGLINHQNIWIPFAFIKHTSGFSRRVTQRDGRRGPGRNASVER